MPTPHDRLLSKAADVVCELSAGQAEALAYEISIATEPRRIRHVAGLAAPAVVGELCDLWVDAPALDGPGLADAIRCAARAVKTVSSYEKVELLYTGPDSGNLRRNLQGLLEVIRGARQHLWVVSYVVGGGVDDVLRAMQERAEAGVTVRVLLDHRIDGYDLAAKRLAAEAPQCEVLIWPDEHRQLAPGRFANLHAKCAVADGRKAFVSSANLTAYAMDHNLEVGYLITGGSTPARLQSHLEELMQAGHLAASMA
jgi:phosphatidylserine/phosphatidylglycerophosphate/cardiolipin synthase-like enzyme